MITARATDPIAYEVSTSSNGMPPGPSSPASMPSTKKTSSSGAPMRDEMSLATMLTSSSAAPIRMT
ncbi:hypothetical protein D3C83_303940 [compost metagenome]